MQKQLHSMVTSVTPTKSMYQSPVSAVVRVRVLSTKVSVVMIFILLQMYLTIAAHIICME